jgi:hypothetical protein
MTTKRLLITTVLSAAVFCGTATLAQTPVQNVDRKTHPNLAQAQSLVVQANTYIETAQRDGKYDMGGHAEKARQLLAQANEELKLAAEAANISVKKKK